MASPESDYAQAASRLYEDRGGALAQGRFGAGQAWAGTLSQLGQTIQQFPEQQARARILQQQQQAGDLELQQRKLQMASEAALNNAISNALNDDGTVNMQKLGQGVANTPAAAKFPEMAQHVQAFHKSSLEITELQSKLAVAERDEMAAAANGADVNPNYLDKAGAILTFVASKQKRGLDPHVANQIVQGMLGPDGQPDEQKVNQTIAQWKQLSSVDLKNRAEAASASSLQTERAAELPGKIANSAVAQQVAAGTVGGVNPDQQARLAIEQANSQRAVTAQAEQARHNRTMEAVANSRESREAANQAAGPGDMGIQSDVRTTSTGRQFIDLSKYKGKDYSVAQRQAKAAGVYGASASETDALQNIETARENMALIAQHIGKLPTSAATRNLGSGLVNKTEAFLQLDPDLAAWGTWRTAAIQAMRALAGSKGLRINRSEIEASTANDIPNITDTQATAKEKLARVDRMLRSQENGLMGASASSATKPMADPLGIR